MKKTYFKFLNALVILCVSLSLASCSDDDDGNGSRTENLLVGKWQPVSVSEESVNDRNSMFYSLRDDIIEFLGDKTVTYDESDTYYFSSKPDPNTKST
ncbi:hypothetical protein [Dysgonomonas sp. Marseille-P4361]|uniref:hypothetical protein n=1 Tax=Dysgonomonas sp. Marseille-P4361 TaxID=2161820 RepID=UPI001356ED50|nr:hypothetical protein [Dysgonomonas sp. Marseille-P4361]